MSISFFSFAVYIIFLSLLVVVIFLLLFFFVNNFRHSYVFANDETIKLCGVIVGNFFL